MFGLAVYLLLKSLAPAVLFAQYCVVATYALLKSLSVTIFFTTFQCSALLLLVHYGSIFATNLSTVTRF
jgi:hypothetical protein